MSPVYIYIYLFASLTSKVVLYVGQPRCSAFGLKVKP